MSNLIWSCTTQDVSITVGQKMIVQCQGSAEGLQTDKLTFKRTDGKEETPSLALIGYTAQDTTTHELILTSYRVGDHKSEDVYLFDGENSVQLDGLTWKVNSVISKTTGQPPQPFPAYEPWEMSYPLWFWVSAVLFFIILFGFPLWIYKKIEARKKAYDSLRNLETVFQPIDQLFRDIRKIEKNLDEKSVVSSVMEMQTCFYLFLARSLQIPFQIWPEKKCFKDLKKKHFRIYRDLAVKLKKYNYELKSLQKGSPSLEDFDLAKEKAQKLSEQVVNYLDSQRKK